MAGFAFDIASLLVLVFCSALSCQKNHSDRKKSCANTEQGPLAQSAKPEKNDAHHQEHDTRLPFHMAPKLYRGASNDPPSDTS
jgi:hypothetical protein